MRGHNICFYGKYENLSLNYWSTSGQSKVNFDNYFLLLDGLLDGLRFNNPLNNISVIFSHCKSDYEWLCAMKWSLLLKRIQPLMGFENGSTSI